MSDLTKLRTTIKYPTSLIVRGVDELGIELAKSLLEQGGYVVVLDYIDDNAKKLLEGLSKYDLFMAVDFADLAEAEEHLRRLDYVFYLGHNFETLEEQISSQDFLEYSKFLDKILDLCVGFEAKFLLSTSLRAHQFLFSNNLLDTKFESEAATHSVYTQAEVQRYAESLVMEYIQKKGVDARVVRLGEVIGEEVLYGTRTDFERLLREAAQLDTMTIHGDGLDSSFYVHRSDAVYGLIKALFSKNTRAEIFTISYEYEIALLSIAYKLNELLKKPKTINFADDDGIAEKHMNLRLYKPAPNLMRVGWKPRVSFERAIKQSYDYIKSLEKAKKQELTVSDTDSKIDEAFDQTHTPLDRLENIRKDQESGRKTNMLVANTTLLEKYKAKKIKSQSSANVSRFLKVYDGLMARIEAFKYLTVRQFVGFGVVGIILTAIYFVFFAPVLSSVRDVYMISQRLPALYDAHKKNDMAQIIIYSSEIAQDLDKLNKRLQVFEGVVSYFDLDTALDELDTISRSQIKIQSGLEDSYKGSKVFGEYAKAFGADVTFVENNPNFLVVNSPRKINTEIKNLDDRGFLIEQGVGQMQGGMQNLRSLDLAISNQEIKREYESVINLYDELLNIFSNDAQSYNFLKATIAREGKYNYAIGVVDDSRPMPSGGILLGVFVMSFEDGGLQGIEYIDETEMNDSYTAGSGIVDKINLIRSTSSTQKSQDAKFGDMAYIYDGALLMDETKYVLENKTQKTINGISIANIRTLENVLEVLGGVDYKGSMYTSQNLRLNLNSLNSNTDEQRKVYVHLYALALQKTLNNMDSYSANVGNAFYKSAKNKDVVMRFYNSDLKTNFHDANLTASTDFLSVNVVSDSVQSNLAANNIKYKVDVLVNGDKTTRKTINIDTTNVTNYEYISICVPGGVSNIQVAETVLYQQNINFNETEACINITNVPENLNEIVFSFDTIAYTSLSEDVDYSLVVRKQPGVITDLEFNLESFGTVQSFDSNYELVQESKKLSIKGSLNDDLILNIDT